MGEPLIRFYTYDPATKARNVYDVPESQADAWEARAQADGIKYSDDQAEAKASIAAWEAGGAVETDAAAEPALAPPPPPTPPPQQAATSTALGRFGDNVSRKAGAVADWLGEGSADFGRSLGGLLQGGVPSVSAALTPEAVDAPGTPRREYAAGSAAADMADQIRRDQADAEKRSPLATGLARGISAASQAIPVGAAAVPAAGAGAAATAANAVAPAVGLGVLARGANALDPRRGFWDWMGEAADPRSAVVDAAIGGSIPGFAQGVSKLASAVAPALKGSADRWRAAASGAYGGELEKLRQAKGDTAAADLGAAIERTGIRPSGIIPKSARDYMEGAERVRGELGERIGGTLRTADDLNVRVPRADVEDDLLGRAREFGRGVTDDAATSARAVGRVLQRTQSRYGDDLKPTELHELKKQTEAAAGFKPGTVRGPKDSARAEANQAAADVFRGHLDRAVNEQIAIPEITNPYNAAMRDYGYAADAGTLAAKRVHHELGNQIFSLPTLIAAGTGAAGGGATGSVGNALVGAGVGGALAAGSKLYGKDMLANTVRGLQHGAEGTARAAHSAAPSAGTGAVFARWLSEPVMPAPDDMPREVPAPASSPPPAIDGDPVADEDAEMASTAHEARAKRRLAAGRK